MNKVFQIQIVNLLVVSGFIDDLLLFFRKDYSVEHLTKTLNVVRRVPIFYCVLGSFDLVDPFSDATTPLLLIYSR